MGFFCQSSITGFKFRFVIPRACSESETPVECAMAPNYLSKHHSQTGNPPHTCHGTFMKLLASRFALAVAGLFLTSSARGSALTTTIAANERICFYTDVDKAGEKIGVRPSYFPSD